MSDFVYQENMWKSFIWEFWKKNMQRWWKYMNASSCKKVWKRVNLERYLFQLKSMAVHYYMYIRWDCAVSVILILPEKILKRSMHEQWLKWLTLDLNLFHADLWLSFCCSTKVVWTSWFCITVGQWLKIHCSKKIIKGSLCKLHTCV